VTESAARSRLIHAVSPMADSSYYREKAAQALRLARENTDTHLIRTLRAYAAECNAKGDVIDGDVLGEDPEDE
jgi:hypothetical protein